MIRTSYDAPETPRPADWRDFAVCPDEDPEQFFPDPGDTRGNDAAKQTCAACLVRRDCLTAALAEEGGRAKESRFGVRGGKTADERYALYQRSRRAAV